jgi:hypothetical protein
MSAASALAIKPGFAHARFVEGVARLSLGDFSAGWRAYEARWHVGWWRRSGAITARRCG